LSQRQQVEVQRLLKHDEQVAQRLNQLRKSKMLVASLPTVDAPEGMLDRIMTSLETRAILEHEAVVATTNSSGATYLFARKLVTAAAMITLMAILAVVVYTILAPYSDMPTDLAGSTSANTFAAASQDFYGRLELKTANLAAFNAVIARAIESQGLEDSVTTSIINGKETYNLVCSRDSAKGLMTKLSAEWKNLDAATLVVETDTFTKEVAVNNVTAQQIERIIDGNTLSERIGLANELAAGNKLAQLFPDENSLPGMQFLTAVPTPVMPVLTGDRDDSQTKAARD